jgi:enoyl-CoA hydratase
MSELVSYKIDRGIATVQMDDGKANALSSAMWDQLAVALDCAEEAGAIVILKGRSGIFSGGYDLKELAQGPEQTVRLVGHGSQIARRLLAFPTPVIAVSTGHCIAMGAFLMLACDYRLGAGGDFKIGLNETLTGMTMHHFGIELARYKLPLNYFGRCVIHAELFAPELAVCAGFYDEVTAPEQLDARAADVASEMSKLNLSAFAATKRKSREQLFDLLDRCIEKDYETPIQTF